MAEGTQPFRFLGGVPGRPLPHLSPLESTGLSTWTRRGHTSIMRIGLPRRSTQSNGGVHYLSSDAQRA
eukprot:2147192-Pleurochrysis_carterae.AAC.2